VLGVAFKEITFQVASFMRVPRRSDPYER